MSGEHVSVYEAVTRSITLELEKGTVPWVKPWKSGISPYPRNAVSQRHYSGVNVLLLWSVAMEKGYTNSAWLTFKQARELNGSVKKGERGTAIVYAGAVKKKEVTKDGEETEKDIHVLKWYYVFNVEQTEKLPEHLYGETPSKPIGEALEHVDVFIRGIGAELRHGGDRAYYSPQDDVIVLPHRGHFQSVESYFATSLHEHAHWSGHPKRLNRDLSGRFGTRAYAAEELIAELTAAFLCATFQIPGELHHTAYIKSWLELLENDKKAIFTAASTASKVAEYLRGKGEHREWVDEYEETERMSMKRPSHTAKQRSQPHE